MIRWTVMVLALAVLLPAQMVWAGGIIQEMRSVSNGFSPQSTCSTVSQKDAASLKDSLNPCVRNATQPRVKLSSQTSQPRISWNAFRLDGQKAKTYKVVRKCSDDDDWETIATVQGNVFTYTDQNSDGKDSCNYNIIGVYENDGVFQEYNYQTQQKEPVKSEVPEMGAACQTVGNKTPSFWFLLLLPLLFVKRRR